MGDALFFSIYVAQQLGVMLGVGAQTVLLCTHLLSIHRNEPDAPHASYAEAARKSLSIGFFLIIISGAAAVAMHSLSGSATTLVAPAFLFKWLLILVVLCAFWFNNRLSHWSNVLAGVSGGTWYALFIVHSLAPVTGWFNLAALYVLWMLLFGIFWSVFVLLMHKTVKAPALAKPAPAPVAVSVPPPVSKPVPPPPVPKPVPPPPPPPPPAAPKPLPPAPKLELASAPHPLSLPVPPAPVIKPVSPPPPPKPPASAVVPPKATLKHGMLHDVIDHLLVPALRIMPKTPADIGKQNRPPVVKLGDE